MKRIQSKITLTYVILTFVVILAVGVLSSVNIESYFKDRLVMELSGRADLMVSLLGKQSVPSPIEADRLLKELSRAANRRTYGSTRTNVTCSRSPKIPHGSTKTASAAARPRVRWPAGSQPGSRRAASRTSSSVATPVTPMSSRKPRQGPRPVSWPSHTAGREYQMIGGGATSAMSTP